MGYLNKFAAHIENPENVNRIYPVFIKLTFFFSLELLNIFSWVIIFLDQEEIVDQRLETNILRSSVHRQPSNRVSYLDRRCHYTLSLLQYWCLETFDFGWRCVFFLLLLLLIVFFGVLMLLFCFGFYFFYFSVKNRGSACNVIIRQKQLYIFSLYDLVNFEICILISTVYLGIPPSKWNISDRFLLWTGDISSAITSIGKIKVIKFMKVSF